MSKTELDIYSHGIRFHCISTEVRELLRTYSGRLKQVEWRYDPRRRRKVKHLKKLYVGYSSDGSEVVFHINLLEDIFLYLMNNGCDPMDHIHINQVPMFTPKPIVLQNLTGKSRRPYQEETVQFGLSHQPIVAVTLQTGKGKTFTSLELARELACRFIVTTEAKFTRKWVNDINDYSGKTAKICYISSVRHLLNTIEEGRDSDWEAMVVSLRMWDLYLDKYRIGADVPSPFTVYDKLGVGFKITDECHKSFGQLFNGEIYSHLPLSVGLSATLLSKDRFVNYIYNIAYPESVRINAAPTAQYVTVEALLYNIDDPEKFKCTRAGQYNHIVFEEYLIRKKKRLKQYMVMIGSIIDDFMKEHYKPGYTMIIYAASIEMCTLLTSFIAEKYDKLNVVRYVESDDYDAFMAADIAVSTIGKSGAAVDKYNLRFVLMTTAIDSLQANLQALGRIREPDDPEGYTVIFSYLVAENIPKHWEYHQNKIDLFKPYVLRHNTYRLGVTI